MKTDDESKVMSQRVADIVAERILSGKLKPDARIKQDELADELNVSRIPVRDALRILETRWMIAAIARKRCWRPSHAPPAQLAGWLAPGNPPSCAPRPTTKF
jgi:DNA-binding GntR family transcriptional regulator